MDPPDLCSLSPLDSRYAEILSDFRQAMGEYALFQRRTEIEIRWLLWLDQRLPNRLFPALSAEDRATLEAKIQGFNPAAALRIKALESSVRHDVKAVELFLRESTAGETFGAALAPFWHFAATSEDINNLAYSLIWKDAQQNFLLPALDQVLDRLLKESRRHSHAPMLSRTHGQPASPTTLGKELANFAWRLADCRDAFSVFRFSGKFNGAVGNYNAHQLALPDVDWVSLTDGFVRSFGLDFQPLTTQIEPHDRLSAWLDLLARTNRILIGLCRDFWGYISWGYFVQRVIPGEVGSSTMPHKVNPIAFENAEGNLGVANALLRHLSDKLPVSRFQRDLSDSTAQRSLTPALGHTLLAWRTLHEGLLRLEADTGRIRDDLLAHPEVIAEGLQTLLRLEGDPDAYERLKSLTRGRSLDAASLKTWIHGLELDAETRQSLERLGPLTYLGLAAELAERFDELRKQASRTA
jgi:adenylosuccinate lyase